ncbi:respiratory nitrate reductase chaperone NarJ [Streptoalloteichus tenebrarius]|uniref:Respiratory nitrate reductase chaperone NarJ n=1 Tax=Streptoalloteichus tenebrarius (strain ATCC 17920 / DSM 40477 / JCM 4838 / CBS 697.72 / NBRC 16177 / NCIMB 11028 / NRRL B-12390 / A12253. 1 / ISP 5477) TaxID=1933 RepID=A0ABT1HRT4_STRSD|nr:nitrate reductase molybdenum cofactor assembly chaperone [Streptoalloteichus tenebrarius]MCP2258228.1 respiratory nitrate reductase chaperone NarJ [Streptoalloteichus tenebrarius]BFF04542.1 nitrate reductase molybdenum cofactor assembly chaperone [Streptoalloteichus tenebrarius]
MTARARRSGPVEADPERGTVFHLLSLLLQYPDAELLAARSELVDAVAALPDSPARHELSRFATWYADQPPMDLARHYVETFDLRRRSSLYLTYYLHGDTRRRGMALLVLKQRYRAAGLTPPDDELPDYLPLVCEFAALAGPGTGEAPLRQHRAGVELIHRALRDAGSPYAGLLGALTALLPGLSSVEESAVAELVAGGPPAEDVGLAPFAPPEYLTGTGARV